MTFYNATARFAVILLVLAVTVACGMKGPPRPPVSIVPSQIELPDIARVRDRVYLTFQVPASDSDGDSPADIERVEVYGVTTQPTSDRPSEEFSDDWLEAATLVASISVRPPGLMPAEVLSDGDEIESEDNSSPNRFEDELVAQGELITIVEQLTPESFIAVVIDDEDEDEDEDEEDDSGRLIPVPFVAPPIPMPAIRSYVAFGVSSRRREGDPSPMAIVPLTEPPESPGPVTVTYTAGAVSVQWEEPEYFRYRVQPEQPAGEFLESEPVLDVSEASEYVILDLASAGDPDSERPEPLGEPQSVTGYTDSEITFGTTACYAVQTLEHVNEDLEIYGDASPATCVVFTDTFPPAPPTGLIAVTDAGSINLVWNENTESDIDGYLVLRGLASDATLEPLTPEPINEPTYRDTSVVSGEQYVYQVMAVDHVVPRNVSQPSGQITQTAR